MKIFFISIAISIASLLLFAWLQWVDAQGIQGQCAGGYGPNGEFLDPAHGGCCSDSPASSNYCCNYSAYKSLSRCKGVKNNNPQPSPTPRILPAQRTQFNFDIFNPAWWFGKNPKFNNDIFNKWIKKPARFINDIFNHNWWLNIRAVFVNDIFNPAWWVDHPIRFIKDIFRRL